LYQWRENRFDLFSLQGKIGIDNVGFGSDFDGAKIPLELKDVTGLPKLIGLLQSIGYDTDSIEKIASKNWLRVLRETWKE